MIKLITPTEEYLTSYYEACVVTWGHSHNNYILHNPAEFDSWRDTIFIDYDNQNIVVDI